MILFSLTTCKKMNWNVTKFAAFTTNIIHSLWNENNYICDPEEKIILTVLAQQNRNK